MSAAIKLAIKLAWPDARAKRIANGLDCSVITAKRIASTGHVSGRFRAALLRLIDEAIYRNATEIERLRKELWGIEHAEMVDRAAIRRAQADLPAAPRAPQGGQP